MNFFSKIILSLKLYLGILVSKVRASKKTGVKVTRKLTARQEFEKKWRARYLMHSMLKEGDQYKLGTATVTLAKFGVEGKAEVQAKITALEKIRLEKQAQLRERAIDIMMLSPDELKTFRIDKWLQERKDFQKKIKNILGDKLTKEESRHEAAPRSRSDAMAKPRSPRQGSDYEKLKQNMESKNLEFDGVSRRIRNLYSRSITIISREIAHLRELSIAEKLPPPFAQNLCGYTKLLSEIMKQEKEMQREKREREERKLSEMSNEEFEKLLKEFLKKGKEMNAAYEIIIDPSKEHIEIRFVRTCQKEKSITFSSADVSQYGDSEDLFRLLNNAITSLKEDCKDKEIINHQCGSWEALKLVAKGEEK